MLNAKTTDGAMTYTACVHYTTTTGKRARLVCVDSGDAYAEADRLRLAGCTAIGVACGLPGIPRARLAQVAS